jgi:hypothetical protein
MGERRMPRPLEAILKWLRWTEPEDVEVSAPDWDHETDPIGTILGEDGFDEYRVEDDAEGCIRLSEFWEGAFELARVLEAGRLRPAEVLALKRRWSDNHLFWHFVDPTLSSHAEARLAGAIVLYECADHILQVARSDGKWKVFNGLQSQPLDALDEFEQRDAESLDLGAEESEAGLDESRVEDDLTDEDFELRQLHGTSEETDGSSEGHRGLS